MATVTSLTGARIVQIEQASIVSARMSGYNLILTNAAGVDINLGNIRGAQGATGPAGTANLQAFSSKAAAVAAGPFPAGTWIAILVA